MKTIDKTNNSKEWDYGTILKCWNVDRSSYDLYRIANSHYRNENKYVLDVLHDHQGLEYTQSCGTYDSIVELKERVHAKYDHVVPVKATIIVEDL